MQPKQVENKLFVGYNPQNLTMHPFSPELSEVGIVFPNERP